MAHETPTTALRDIPSVEVTLQLLQPFIDETGIPRGLVTECARQVTEAIRQSLLSGKSIDGDIQSHVLDQIKRAAKSEWASSIPRAINATGIILHTGLGRAPLSPLAKEYVLDVLDGYSILAFSEETGERRERHFHTEQLLAKITGAESGILINNNAAATILVLSTFCKDKEAIVSRGELVEIGGSFRIPDVMAQSGAIMVEVGTTNRTHLRDYENAINENTGLMIKVHKSNYKVIGFSSEPPLHEMVELGRKHDVLVYHDLGSGALLDFSRYGLSHEPTVQESVLDGADIITFSGDKLMGGPQSGIIIGKKKYIDRIKKNPLVRATRCGKLTYAVVEATLKLFLDEKTAVTQNKTVRMLVEPVKTLKTHATKFLNKIKKFAPSSIYLSLEEEETFVGGGSMPGEAVPSVIVTLQDPDMPSQEFAYRLRQYKPAIFTRVQDEKVIFDFRTLEKEEIPVVISALETMWGGVD